MQKNDSTFYKDGSHATTRQFQTPQFRIARGFHRKEWAEEFLDGHIYMNALGYFWKGGNKEQADFAEGVCVEVPPEKLSGFTRDFQEAQAKHMSIIPNGMQYCNVCCFSRQVVHATDNVPGVWINQPPESLDLGEHLAVIDNPLELVKRVELASQRLGCACVMGPVEYRETKWLPLDHTVKGTVSLKSHEPLSVDTLFVGDAPAMTADGFVRQVRFPRTPPACSRHSSAR